MSTTEDELQILAEQAGALATAVTQLNTDMSDQVRRLGEVVRRDRRMTKLLIISVILDVILSLGMGYVAITATRADSQAHTNSTNAKITCEVGNQARAAQINLWEYILNLSANSPQTPPPTAAQKHAQEELIRKFRIYLLQVFAPRDCEDLSKVNPVPTPPR